jgi:hypothetical protein
MLEFLPAGLCPTTNSSCHDYNISVRTAQKTLFFFCIHRYFTVCWNAHSNATEQLPNIGRRLFLNNGCCWTAYVAVVAQ